MQCNVMLQCNVAMPCNAIMQCIVMKCCNAMQCRNAMQNWRIECFWITLCIVFKRKFNVCSIKNSEFLTKKISRFNALFSVDGNWGAWSNYGKCSKSCGSGTQLRRRSCDKPPMSNGGTPCDGSSVERRVCSTRPCPGTS